MYGGSVPLGGGRGGVWKSTAARGRLEAKSSKPSVLHHHQSDAVGADSTMAVHKFMAHVEAQGWGAFCSPLLGSAVLPLKQRSGSPCELWWHICTAAQMYRAYHRI